MDLTQIPEIMANLMGILGILFMVATPILFVSGFKDRDLSKPVIALGLGIALFIGWVYT